MSFDVIVKIVMKNLMTIPSAVLETIMLEVILFLVIFRMFTNWKCHFRPKLQGARYDVEWLYVLQSYRSCIFVKCKSRGETQLWQHLQLRPYSQIRMKLFPTTNCDLSSSLHPFLAMALSAVSTLVATGHLPCYVINKHYSASCGR